MASNVESMYILWCHHAVSDMDFSAMTAGPGTTLYNVCAVYSPRKIYMARDLVCFVVVKHCSTHILSGHYDVIKWKHFLRYWPFVRGIHRSPVNSAHKGQWRGALMFPLICVWINGWVTNREAGDLRFAPIMTSPWWLLHWHWDDW